MYELYDPNNTYVSEDGNYITPEEFKKAHNVAGERILVVKLSGRTIIGVYDYDYLISEYQVAGNTPEENLELIERKDQLDATETPPLERIASSLEYMVVSMMGANNEF